MARGENGPPALIVYRWHLRLLDHSPTLPRGHPGNQHHAGDPLRARGERLCVERQRLALAVLDTDRILLVTGTAPRESFKKYEPGFRAAIGSFRVAR